MDIGLLVLRTVLAAILFTHATQKLAGWFHGPGLARATTIFEELDQRPAWLMVRLAITCELTGGALVLLGLAMPLGAAITMGTMLVAGLSATVAARAFWNTAGGGEYPLVLGGCAAALAFTGPGGLALDAMIGMPWTTPTGGHPAVVGVLTACAALIAAAPPILRTLSTRRGTDSSTST
ncbi:DoxX family protein [Pseudonocardia sp. CA-107938]|uniref:DoxX family protein n=1 Tax=Pseudonocardia sp. CA-107938 TaxID=3240021 RepID=UPI003D8CD569